MKRSKRTPEKIKNAPNSVNAVYVSVESVSSSLWPSKSIKTVIYRGISLLDVPYGCPTLSVPLREECGDEGARG
jgi:hypothetical protein